MSYKEQLEKFKATGLTLWEVVTAAELEAHAELELSDEEFEVICAEIYDWFMCTEASIQEITDAWVEGLLTKQFTVEDLKSKYDDVIDIVDNIICSK